MARHNKILLSEVANDRIGSGDHDKGEGQNICRANSVKAYEGYASYQRKAGAASQKQKM